MAKEVIMKCPSCGTIVRGRYGFFNKEFTCSSCRTSINPKTDSSTVVECATCGNSVIFDTRVGKEQTCPICNSSLSSHAITDLEVTCPHCKMKQIVKNTESSHVCSICGSSFDVKKASAIQDAEENGTASVITVPAGNKDIIWVHPMSVFPFSSQVVVPEGYTALILRDGICSAPSEPGKYVLSDTIRTKAQQLEYALWDNTAQISVQVLFVRKLIDKSFKWTGQKQPVTDRTGKIVGTLGFGGGITLTVDDAKRFAEFVGYEATTADQLINWQDGKASKLCEYVSQECFESAYQVLVSAVMDKGQTYEVLNTMKLIFKNQIQNIVNNKLGAIGVSSSLFSLDFINFEADSSVKAEEIKGVLESENLDQIRLFVQRPFTWEAPAVPVHMKGDLTLSANIIFGGDIKFRIADEAFFRNPEVQFWMKDGIAEKQVSEYCANLARIGTGKVISDVLQPMINDTDADIRDLNIYYQYIRETIEKELSRYFAKDGLSIDLFSMEEKSRTQSVALNAKGEVEVHKSKEQIQMDLYAFNQRQQVEKAVIDGQTAVDIDTNAVHVQQAMTKNAQARAEDEIQHKYIKESIYAAGEQIERDREKKYTSWKREDEVDEINYQHQQKIDAYGRANEIADLDHNVVKRDYNYAKEMNAMQHEAVMTGIDQSDEVKAALHQSEMKGYAYGQDIAAAEHTSAMQKIGNETEERMELHYLNQQEIDNRAKELYAEWEFQRKMEYEQLAHKVKMQETSWSAQKSFTRESSALEHEMQQADAENERMIASILRKIAESDMELTEKRDAYARLLRNQSSEDAIRQMREEASARTDIYYNDAHMRHTLRQEEAEMSFAEARMKNTLKEQENDIFYKNEHMKNLLTKEEKELIDEMIQREYLRQESAKDAAFNRSMKEKERDAAHEMDILKLDYDRYQMESALKQEIKNKELEIEQLKVMLEHQERMGSQNVQIAGIQSNTQIHTKEAEYRYYGEQAKAEYAYKAEAEKAAREAREKLEAEKLEAEKIYMKRADELMSQMLSIQAAIKNHSLDNENTAIHANADIQIARVQADGAANRIASSTNSRIKEMENLMKEMNRSIQSLNDSVQKMKKNQTKKDNGHHGGYAQPVYPYPPQGTNYQPTQTYGQNYRQSYGQGAKNPYSSQPGTKTCPHCGASVQQYSMYCPKCSRKI